MQIGTLLANVKLIKNIELFTQFMTFMFLQLTIKNSIFYNNLCILLHSH